MKYQARKLFKGLDVDGQEGWNVARLFPVTLPACYFFLIPNQHIEYINPLNNTIMTAKDQAVRDIENDLRLQGKCFMAFHTELDSTMRSLVREQIKEQMVLSPFPQVHSNSQLIGRCTFDKKTNQVKFENYDKYYRN